MFDKNRLTKLREEMKKNGDKSYIILTGDPHSSEYVASKFIAERFYFSPFTGSDGSLVVTLDGAYLFTDGRYFIQAEKELADSSVTLMKMGTKGCPTIAEFIAQNDLYPTAGNLFYMPEGFYEGVAKNGIVNDRDYSYLVENKPELAKDKVFALDEKLFTLSFKEKVAKVASEIENKGADSIIITTLDDIAYILNWRGNDIECTPVFYSFLYINKNNEVHLFIDKDKLSDVDYSNIHVHEYDDVVDFIKEKTNEIILVDKTKINAKLYNLIAKPLNGKSPSYLMKAVKGPVEIENIKRIHELDGVAMLKFYDFLYTNLGKNLSEYEYAEELEKYRRQSKDCFELSFETIAAVGENAAQMHYGPTKDKSSIVTPNDNVLLVDSGGQYFGGTTDITRTFLLKEPDAELRRDYTLTLKSVINLTTSIFMDGCAGTAIDIKAREIMWRLGMDYKCGTGHGVGYILGVHEGPNGFRYKHVPERDDGSKLEPGMITTIEPGVYKASKYGIRIENELLTVPAFETEDGVFYKFETVTYCPIETKYLDLGLLSDNEISWINNYHQMVYEKLSKKIQGNERLLALLKMLTKAVER